MAPSIGGQANPADANQRRFVAAIGPQQRLVGKIARRADALCDVRRAEGRQWRGKQVDGIGAAPRAVAIANRKIETFAREIDAVVVGPDAHVDERMQRLEGGQSTASPSQTCRRPRR
jgi:hypothetical protein